MAVFFVTLLYFTHYALGSVIAFENVETEHKASITAGLSVEVIEKEVISMSVQGSVIILIILLSLFINMTYVYAVLVRESIYIFTSFENDPEFLESI